MNSSIHAQPVLQTPPQNDSDDFLILRAGDSTAFERIYDRFGTALYRYLNRMVGPTDAPDLLQDLFNRLLRSTTPYQGQGTLSAWLYRVASSLAIDRLRIRNRCVDEEVDHFIPPDPAPGVLDSLLSRERGIAVRAIVESLPPAQKAVVVLRFWEEKSLCEIGQILGIPEGTVKSRLHYALDRLSLDLEVWR